MEFKSEVEWWITPKQALKIENQEEEEREKRELKLGKFMCIHCYKCKQEGHYAIVCPKKFEKKEVLPKRVQCFKCKKMGHYIHKCPKTKKKPRRKCFW